MSEWEFSLQIEVDLVDKEVSLDLHDVVVVDSLLWVISHLVEEIEKDSLENKIVYEIQD